VRVCVCVCVCACVGGLVGREGMMPGSECVRQTGATCLQEHHR
jgi:hypothetical protein